MRRLLLLALALLQVVLACAPLNQDQKALARYLARSSDLPRAFTYRAWSPDAAFEVRGAIEDDFRYALTLSFHGRQLVSEIVSDDALAVRLLDPAFGASLSNTLGHPTVDAALRAGRWVIDPAGAPPLINPNANVSGETTGDPFRDARQSFMYVTRSMNEASGVQRFNLENIEYRPLFDPWRYPTSDELRYDLMRPPLPKSAGVGGASDTVTPAQFRKLSVFIKGRRVEQTCEYIDIEGHEEFVALRERGLDSNPYLRDLLRRIERRQTSIPIVPRIVVEDVSYPPSVVVDVPKDAVPGKLDTFQAAFQQAITSGALRPAPSEEGLTECRRQAKTL